MCNTAWRGPRPIAWRSSAPVLRLITGRAEASWECPSSCHPLPNLVRMAHFYPSKQGSFLSGGDMAFSPCVDLLDPVLASIDAPS